MRVPQRIITVGLNPTIDRVLEVPRFAAGETLQGRLRWLIPDGKAFNVSLALSGLGVPSTAVGFMAADGRELFEAAAAEAGINVQFTPIPGRTRQNITILDPLTRSETHIRDVGPAVTDGDVDRLLAVLLSLCGPEAMMVFSGSLPPGLPPARFGQVLDACIAAGAAVAVDSSGEPLREAARRKLWLLKPNEAELHELFTDREEMPGASKDTGRSLPPTEITDSAPAEAETFILTAGRLLNAHISVVLITAGARGAWCFADANAWHAVAAVPAERIRSVTGCGDAFLAGFLAAATRGEAPDAALRRAVSVAAASALNEQPSKFRPQDVPAIEAAAMLRRIL